MSDNPELNGYTGNTVSKPTCESKRDLNSVLIEGRVRVRPWQLDTNSCKFVLGAFQGSDTILVPIRAEGRLGEMCLAQLQINQGLRVVGRLNYTTKSVDVVAGTVYSRLGVFAEHVEFKPLPEPKKEENEHTVGTQNSP